MKSLDLTNHFLIAMPSLLDPNFFKTVTLICAHSEKGAMGIVINRPTTIRLGEVLGQMEIVAADSKINDMTIYEGGPVQRDRGFVIYRPLGQWVSTLEINDTYGVATSRDILEAISRGSGPENTLIALGYAGWGAGQLEQELAENAWLSSPAEESILFHVPAEDRWRSAAALLGIEIEYLSDQTGHA